MTPWLRHHGVSFSQTMRRFASSPLASLLNALVLGIALALPLTGYVMLGNLQHFSRNVSTDAQISAFLARNVSKHDIAEIEKRLRALGGVRKIEFVSREQALIGLKRSPEMAEVIATLRDNPLPDAFLLTLSVADPSSVQHLEQEIREIAQIATVQTDSAWMQRVGSLLRVGQTAVMLMATLLSFALVAVTFNTIRLQILTQRDEIEVSKLIGATNAYIRRPFFYLGGLQGLFGGLAAWGIVEVTVFLLNRDLAGLATIYGVDARLAHLDVADGIAVLAFSAALGWLGAMVSVSKHLYKIEPS